MDNNDFYSYKYRKDPESKTVRDTVKEKSNGKKSFTLTIIISMLITMLLSVGITLLLVTNGGTNIQRKTISTTNYDLVKSTGSELSIQEIAVKNENSVVAITTEALQTSAFFGQYVTSGAGSGVIYSEDGYILTNNHVIEGATKIVVTLHNNNEYTASLVATDPQNDVAVIKIEETGLTPVTVGNSDSLSVGDLSVAIGNPLGTLSGTVTQGIVSALERTITIDGKQMTLIQTDAAINPGNSGGGLFNEYGDLIGLVVAKSSGSAIEGLGFAIPSNKVRETADSLIENGYVTGRPQIGISIVDLTNVSDAWQAGVSYPGVYIQAVTGDNATKAGLKIGDMIYKIDGQIVTSSSMLIGIVQTHSVGDKVNLTIIRNSELDKMIPISVELEEAKTNE